jgi:hypothetical protein
MEQAACPEVGSVWKASPRGWITTNYYTVTAVEGDRLTVAYEYLRESIDDEGKHRITRYPVSHSVEPSSFWSLRELKRVDTIPHVNSDNQ